MTNKVNCKTATDVSERCSVSVFTVQQSILLKLLDPKDERNKILRNVYNCFFIRQGITPQKTLILIKVSMTHSNLENYSD